MLLSKLRSIPNQLSAVSTPLSAEIKALCLKLKLPAIMVLVSTELINATAAKDITIKAIKAIKSTTPDCLVEWDLGFKGKRYLVMLI